jgi:hypothetical protein
MTTLSSQPLSRSALARMPFFWWRQQADWPVRQRAGKTAGRRPADDCYIPSGTADLWRSAKPHAPR